MEQRGVIHFLTLKRLKAQNVHAELTSVYGPEALALATVKKWPRRFQQGERDLFNDSRSGAPLTNDFGEAIGSMLAERLFSPRKVLCRHFSIGKTAWMRILHAKLGFSLGAASLVGHAKRRKSIVFEALSEGTDGTQANVTFTELSVVTSRGSSCIIPVTPSGQPHVMTFLIESNKNMTHNSA
jgi:hypothetical protein